MTKLYKDQVQSLKCDHPGCGAEWRIHRAAGTVPSGWTKDEVPVIQWVERDFCPEHVSPIKPYVPPPRPEPEEEARDIGPRFTRLRDTDRRRLEREFAASLNKIGAENGSNTPDYLLAEYLVRCLDAYNEAVVARERWGKRWNGK